VLSNPYNSELLGFSILGISVIVHIIIVNITIGTGWISAMARFLAWIRNAPPLEIMSRRVFKILIIHELFSGVWGTIITVILAGFFPTLTAIATDIIFYPILIALAAIFIRIPSIALFWYTWGKVRPSTHSVLGFVMALSGFGVPLGFRYIFAQTTFPDAIVLASQGFRELSRIAVFFNPVYFPLILHTWFGAMSIGGFIVASFFTIKGNVNAKFVWIGLWHGVLFLVLQLFMGPWYLLTLGAKAPLLFDNIVGGAGSTLNLLPILASKILIVGGLAILSVSVWKAVKRGTGTVPRYAIVLGPVAVLVAMLGEFMNDGGRYPFAVLAGQSGIRASVFMNVYIEMPITAVLVIVGTLIAFIGVFMATAYYALNRRFLADLPEGIR
jgi:cytochrome d ubiquinol oxidase subunit I